MKKILLLALFALVTFAVDAQEVKFPGLDGSPVDLAYFPSNAAHENTTPDIKLIYSRPSKKGRVIFGELEKYGAVYRLGANESNEITFFKDVTVGGKPVKAGTYSLFAIPNKDNWTIIINSKINSWGAYTYDVAKDVARADVPVKALTTPVEALSMVFTKTDTGANLNIGWDTVSVAVPITIK